MREAPQIVDHSAAGPSRAAYTVDEFCQAHRICRAKFYNMVREGKGPRVMKAGTRTLISVEAAAEWRRQLEAEAAEAQGNAA